MKAKTNGVPFSAAGDKKLSPTALWPGGGGRVYSKYSPHSMHLILTAMPPVPYGHY